MHMQVDEDVHPEFKVSSPQVAFPQEASLRWLLRCLTPKR